MPLEVSPPEIVLSKRELLAALEAKVALRRRDPLRYYCPHHKQDLFHRAGTYKYRGLFAGNRFGKSHCGAAEDVAWCRGERSWYPVGHLARKAGIPNHPVKLLVITTDWDKVKEIWTGPEGKIWKYMSEKEISGCKTTRNHSGAIDNIRWENGSLISFDTVRSFSSNPQGSESSDWDAIHGDEPFPYDMWIAVSRGLMDRGGKAWFTLTAIKEPWIFDFFFGRDQLDAMIGGLSNDLDKKWCIRGLTTDNTFLTPEDIEDYKKTLSEDEIECRLNGIPLEFSGIVYKEFEPSKHVYREVPRGWEAADKPPVDWPVWVMIDPHPQTANAVLFLTCSPVAPWNTIYYFDEIFEKCMADEMAAKILARVARFKNTVKFRADAWIFPTHENTGQCMARDLRKLGLPVQPASKRKEQGIIRARQDLKADKRLMFGSHLRRTIWEFGHFVWDERENKPKDKDDHMMENFYRSLQENPRYYPIEKVGSGVLPEIEIVGSGDLSTI